MSLAIHDLPASRSLDRHAMKAVRGGGAPWVFGAFTPYVPESMRQSPSMNFFQINNYYADQMNNQIQVVDIKNSAANANISVSLDQLGNNLKP